jgi:hypothetical protein
MVANFNVDYELGIKEPTPHDTNHNKTGAVSNLKLAQEWLRTCLENHEDCAKKDTTIGLPSRLIDIGQSSTNDQLRLYMNDMPPGIQYATLSHCWGTIDIVKLTRQNIQEFQDKIDFEKLTKTFQQTIQVIRYLGLRYLWIDCLCIIQDDKDDWAKESGLMASVYGGSALNIAATGARNGSEGLLSRRDPNGVRRLLVWASPNMRPDEDNNGFSNFCVAGSSEGDDNEDSYKVHAIKQKE